MKIIATQTVLGIELSTINDLKMVLSFIHDNIQKKGYLIVLNVHLCVLAKYDKSLRHIINSSILTIADGNPLVVLSNIIHSRKINRITGPDLFRECLFDQKLKHFLLGSTGPVLDELMHSSPNIVGSFSPPFRSMDKKEILKIFEEINALKPDIVWVALGAPKQEYFIANNIKYLNRGLMIPVGAAFSYQLNIIKRAPSWMQKWSLEWLYRLAQEPRRLWKRYMFTNPMFLIHSFFEVLDKKIFIKKNK
jgi:N-acetylglucosaminyldiphosphoundecaprenol N-acetyl-beta-D-mannosaminyltransferase